MIIFREDQIELMIAHCKKELPNESCGLLAGNIKEDIKTIKQVYFLENIDHSPEHFSMDAKEQFKALSDIRKNSWQLIGNFHSHPSTPSRPSVEDIRLAFDPNLSYSILSLENIEQPVLNSFTIKGFAVEIDPLKVVE